MANIGPTSWQWVRPIRTLALIMLGLTLAGCSDLVSPSGGFTPANSTLGFDCPEAVRAILESCRELPPGGASAFNVVMNGDAVRLGHSECSNIAQTFMQVLNAGNVYIADAGDDWPVNDAGLPANGLWMDVGGVDHIVFPDFIIQPQYSEHVPWAAVHEASHAVGYEDCSMNPDGTCSEKIHQYCTYREGTIDPWVPPPSYGGDGPGHCQAPNCPPVVDCWAWYGLFVHIDGIKWLIAVFWVYDCEQEELAPVVPLSSELRKKLEAMRDFPVNIQRLKR